MIKIITDKTTATITTPKMEIIVSLNLWTDRKQRQAIIKMAKGD